MSDDDDPFVQCPHQSTYDGGTDLVRCTRPAGHPGPPSPEADPAETPVDDTVGSAPVAVVPDEVTTPGSPPDADPLEPVADTEGEPVDVTPGDGTGEPVSDPDSPVPGEQDETVDDPDYDRNVDEETGESDDPPADETIEDEQTTPDTITDTVEVADTDETVDIAPGEPTPDAETPEQVDTAPGEPTPTDTETDADIESAAAAVFSDTPADETTGGA